MVKGLEVFTHGQIQDALNILTIMERESLTVNDLKQRIQDMIFYPPKVRKGFMRRFTKEQREIMKTQRGMQRQPCVRCDEKRRGKK